MQEAEKQFLEICQKYNDVETQDYKGSLLFKAFIDQKHGEELLASYITVKQKFDSLYAFLLTKTRIIEINAYSTMFITSSRKFKEIKKVVLEQAFDDKQIDKVLSNDINPERVQLRINFIDHSNQPEELAWENIEDEQSIIQALGFANRLMQIQAGL